MQKSRTELNDTGMSASAPAVAVTAAAGASMSSASSSCTVEFHSAAGKSASESKDSRAMFQTYVRVRGRDGRMEGCREGGRGGGEEGGRVALRGTSKWRVGFWRVFRCSIYLVTSSEYALLRFSSLSCFYCRCLGGAPIG